MIEIRTPFQYLMMFIGDSLQYILLLSTIQNLTADYSLESHSLDLDRYVSVVQRRRRRAKALVDFDRHDHDELGFKKNDVINVCICHIAPSIFLCLFLSISF